MKKLLLLLTICSCSFFAKAQQDDTIQRAKILFNQSDDLKRIVDLGIALDHGIHKKDYYFISEFAVRDLDKIRAQGFQVEILEADVKAAFLAANQRSMVPVPMQNPSDCVNAPSAFSNFSISAISFVTC